VEPESRIEPLTYFITSETALNTRLTQVRLLVPKNGYVIAT